MYIFNPGSTRYTPPILLFFNDSAHLKVSRQAHMFLFILQKKKGNVLKQVKLNAPALAKRYILDRTKMGMKLRDKMEIHVRIFDILTTQKINGITDSLLWPKH